jgi:hypothetical protein
MNPLFAQCTPFFLAVLAVGLGVIYSNSRITDIKDLIRAESNALRAEILRVEGTLRSDLTRVETTVRADIAGLDRRMNEIEKRMDRFERERLIRS